MRKHPWAAGSPLARWMVAAGAATTGLSSTGDVCEVAKLVAENALGADEFGSGVGASDGTFLVGAHLDDDLGQSSCSTYVFQLDTPGTPFCAGDGSVHFLSETIDFRLYNELGTIAGGEVASLP